MTTIPCDQEQFNKACASFMKAIGNKKTPPESIANMHKGLGLYYLGLEGDEEALEQAADMYHVMTQNALARGWDL